MPTNTIRDTNQHNKLITGNNSASTPKVMRAEYQEKQAEEVAKTLQETLVKKMVNFLEDISGENNEIVTTTPMGFKTICLRPKESEKYVGKENPIVRITFTNEGINIEINNNKNERIQGLNLGIEDVESIKNDIKKFIEGEYISLPVKFKIDGGLSKTEEMSDADIEEYLKYYQPYKSN